MLIKALLGYTFSIVVIHLVANQVIIWCGYENLFYKPDLLQILKPIVETVQN